MLSNVLYWLVNMSLSATVTGLLVFILSKIKGIPPKFKYIFWMIPFLRMVIPFGLYSKFSLVSVLNSKSVTVYDGIADFTMTNYMQLADSYFPVNYKTEMIFNTFKIASVIWLIVFLIIAFLVVFLYITGLNSVKTATKIKDNIYVCENIKSPAVYGVFKAKIILPNHLTDEVDLIIKHEQIHIKRFDNLLRMTAIIIAAVHWFNPFVWIFLKQLIIYQELSCDQKVLESVGNDKKKYASMLVNCAKEISFMATGFGGGRLKKRVEYILSYKKLSAFSLVCLTVFATIVAYLLLTNGK